MRATTSKQASHKFKPDEKVDAEVLADYVAFKEEPNGRRDVDIQLIVDVPWFVQFESNNSFLEETTNMVKWWEEMMPAGTTDKPSEEWPVLSYKWTAEQIAWARGKNVGGCRPWNEVDTICYDTNGIQLFLNGNWKKKTPHTNQQKQPNGRPPKQISLTACVICLLLLRSDMDVNSQDVTNLKESDIHDIRDDRERQLTNWISLMLWVVIIIIILKSSLSKMLGAMTVLKFIVFFQFVPRVIRIYPLFRKATSTRILAEVTWVKAAFNLYLYMFSGHVFGALWYFFAIDTEIKCWKKACTIMNQTGCNHRSFNCHKSLGNYKFLNDACSTKSQNTDFYDFGIFHDALQSGVVLEGSFLQKFMYCFRWGLQSLSCFAQNLVPSINIWENVFTISITISSVVLFIFLLGNMQLFLQSETARSEDMKLKLREIEKWTNFKKLTKDLQQQVKKYQRHVWRETKGVDVENLLNNLPKDLRMKIKCEFCLDLLKRVPKFKILSEQQLKVMCERLKPVLYPAETYIVRKGDTFDEMLFIMRGELLSTSNVKDRNFTDIQYLKEFCGEELSSWVIYPEFLSDLLPISTRTIKTHTEVEAFALKADDLKDVFTQFKRSLHSFRYKSSRWKDWAARLIQVNWRKLEEHRHENEKRVKNASGATSSA
ncbi:hypothetical protein LWI29_001801 [Acer saccharum]|uniref:Cyclic nucleotide-binding domain-containing protein n=1 Tax=Acer saccharum TaxID=4024 RepID=A0AA39SQE5_ACESA|nr:hypothetical protein LWI29_001801 [Acer saccharum]